MKTGKLWKLAIPTLLLVAVCSLMPKMDASATEPKLTKESHTFGDGTTAAAYKITSAADLIEFSNMVNSCNNDTEQKGMNAFLENDIDFKGIVKDNTSSNFTAMEDFYGRFDGQNHTIRGLIINSIADGQGLFSTIYTGALLEDVCLEGGSITGGSYVGGVCGVNNGGTITDCINTGAVNGTSFVGGVCGVNSGGTITNCTNTGAISGTDFIGGVCGSSDGTINDCINTGAVSGKGDYDVGGVCGSNGGTITNCTNTGTVNGTSFVGGVCGNSATTITNCTNTGAVSGTGNYIGGVCGYNQLGTITNCYYDKQICTVGGIDGTDVSGQAEGRLTTEMTGEALKTSLGAQTNWVFTESMYPRLKSMKDTDAAILAATPIFLQVNTSTNPQTYDTATNVAENFKLGTDNGVSWSSNDKSAFYIKQDQVIVNRAGMTAALTATKGDVSRSITLTSSSSVSPQDGTKEHPLTIDSKDELISFRDAINGNNRADYKGVNIYHIDSKNKFFLLTTDLDLSSICGVVGTDGVKSSWTPIGGTVSSFQGNFDGGGHTITGVYINRTSPSAQSQYQGLFGRAIGATIENLRLEGGSITGYRSVGSVCGQLENGTIQNCYNNVEVIGSSQDIGGICGQVQNSTIQNCGNNGAVSGLDTSSNSRNVGGVCGYFFMKTGQSGTIQSCYNTGTVTGDDNVGAICGSFRAENNTLIDTLMNYCYYNAEKCYVGAISGADVPGRAIGLTTLQMTGSDALTDMTGFDSSIWATYENALSPTGDSATLYYPQLKVFCSASPMATSFVSENALISFVNVQTPAVIDLGSFKKSEKRTSVSVEVMNKGTADISTFGIITQASETDFDFKVTSSPIAPGAKTTIEITPKEGLAPGTYQESFTVSSSHGVALTATVKCEIVKDPLTGTVSITRLPADDAVLLVNIASTNITGTISYQWKRGGNKITNVNAESYTITAADIGQTLSCVVTSTEQAGELTGSITNLLKAKRNSAPTGLSGVSTTFEGDADGKLSGTDVTMEWSTNSSFNEAVTTCDSPETTGLTAGTYYVRYREDDTHTPSPNTAVTITDGPTRVYDIDLSTSIANAIFEGRKCDYETLPAAMTVTITNNGNSKITGWSVAGNKAVSDFYVINQTSEISPNATATFTIVPKPDLAQGIHSETFTVTTDDLTQKSVTVSFTVEHNYQTMWAMDASEHWHECSCGSKIDKEAHTPGTEATEDTPQLCKTCGYVVKKATGHVIHKTTPVPEVEATCCTDGHKAYYTCSGCNDWFSDAAGTQVISNHDSIIIPATGNHIGVGDWLYDTTNHWKLCSCGVETDKAVHTPGTEATEDTPQLCKTCGYVVKKATGHVIHKTTSVPEVEATCCADGHKSYYTCSGCNDWFSDAAGTQVISNHDSFIIPATGNHIGVGDWLKDATSHWKLCACNAVTDKAVHTPGDWIIDLMATTTADGSKHKECTVCRYLMQTGTITKLTDPKSDTQPAPIPQPIVVSKPVPVEINPLSWYYAVKHPGTLCIIREQGAECVKAIKNAMPKGFEQAFTFNISFDDDYYIPNYSLKKSSFRLTYQEKYKKAGRTFALIGINRNGEAKIFYDEDKSDETITVNLNIEGYAFALIYSDTEKGGKVPNDESTIRLDSIVSNDDYYTVQPGDTLWGIARKFSTSANYLASINNLKNINFLRIGQRIKVK